MNQSDKINVPIKNPTKNSISFTTVCSIEFPFFIRHSNKKNRLLRISCRNW